jgi:hypothetical protein
MSSVNVNVMNASMNVPNSVVSMLTNLARDVVLSCATRHGFDAEEEMRHLGLDTGVGITFTEKKGKTMLKESAREGKGFRGNFPLPYNGEHDESCCSGLKENQFLMTQCQNGRKGEGNLCKTCENQAAKNENGLPKFGTIEMRKACGIFEYIAPNGKKPVAYSQVMKKLKLSMEEVESEAAKRNMVLDKRHFEEVVETKNVRAKKVKLATGSESTSESSSDEKPKAVKGKGRPKKADKVVELAEPTDDLFASLMASTPKAVEEEPKAPKKRVAKKKAVAVEPVAVEPVAVEPVAVEPVAKVVEPVAKVVEPVAKVVEPVAKVVEPVAKVVEPVAKVVEKVAEKVVEKVEEDEEEEEEDDEEVDDVVRIEYKGVKYLRSENTGVIYNMDEDVVGKWNEKTKEIDFHDVEEEEEEYDEE